MEQKRHPGEESPKPEFSREFSRFSVINRDNRLRQAMQALLITHFTMLEAHLNQYPASAPVVTLAGDLLNHLRRYVQDADTLQAAVHLDAWWALYQGPSHQYVDFLNTKIEALTLLAPLFASLKRLGLTVVHERPQP